MFTLWAYGLVKILKLKFRQDFLAEVWSVFCQWCFVDTLKKVWCFILAQVKIVPKKSFSDEECPVSQNPQGSSWKHISLFFILICFNSFSERTFESHIKPVACPRAATVCRWGEVNHYFIFFCVLEVEIYMIISFNFLILRKYW